MIPKKEIQKKILSSKYNFSECKIVKLKKYFSTNLKVYALPVPMQRKLLWEGYSWSEKSFNYQLEVWDEVWNQGESIEELSQALFWLQSIQNDNQLFKSWYKTYKWVNRVDNWVHSDNLSHSYSRCLEVEQSAVYSKLVYWSKSANSWKRRQSVVSLFFYSRLRKKFLKTDKIFPLLNILIEDDNYFVQKGIGWCLREAYNVYPEKTFKFIEKNIKKISTIAFSSSTEKITKKKKNYLKKIRRKKL